MCSNPVDVGSTRYRGTGSLVVGGISEYSACVRDRAHARNWPAHGGRGAVPDVLKQFLAEAVLISVTGGIAGIVAGVGISDIISLFSEWSSPISLPAVAIGFLYSAAVGIFFQALRYE